jgi:pimeloyl-ACP methyl ester carboxylesterase
MWFRLLVVVGVVLTACGQRPMSPVRITGPAGALAIDDGGRGGLPVVFVHSLAGNSNQWAAQLQHLRPSRRAVALDLRGHGRSEPPTNGDYSIAGMAEDIGVVVDTLGLDRFVLVGHSMGGGVALSYAGAHPERVAGLLLVDPIGDGKQISGAEIMPLFAGLDSNYDTTIREYWTGIAGPDSAVRERLLADLRATPRKTVVPAFHCRSSPHTTTSRSASIAWARDFPTGWYRVPATGSSSTGQATSIVFLMSSLRKT